MFSPSNLKAFHAERHSVYGESMAEKFKNWQANLRQNMDKKTAPWLARKNHR